MFGGSRKDLEQSDRANIRGFFFVRKLVNNETTSGVMHSGSS